MQRIAGTEAIYRRRTRPGRELGDGRSLMRHPASHPILRLDNGRAWFEFEADDLCGLALARFAVGGEHVWRNRDPAVWRLTLRRVTEPELGGDTFHTLEPVAFGLLQPPAIITSSVGQSITAVWQHQLGADTIRVTAILELRHGDDYLRANVTAAWQGTATQYAVDCVSALPLRVDPYQIGYEAGSDRALCPILWGGLVEDPIRNLHFAYGDWGPDNNHITFSGGKCRQHFGYPNGFDWGLGVFGYWDTSSRQAWQVYLAKHTTDQAAITWQSDRFRMLWESYVPQPDSVIAGNGGRPITHGFQVELRPFVAASADAWIDMGRHYGRRLDEEDVFFWRPSAPNDPTLDDLERGPQLWFWPLNTGADDTRPTITVQDYIDDAITAAGGKPGQTPAFGLGNYKQGSLLDHPFDVPLAGTEDVREAMLAARDRLHLMGHQKPGFFLPVACETHFVEPGNDDWHTEQDWPGAFIASKQGWYDGDDETTKDERDDGSYYAEDLGPHAVTAWASGTPGLLTVAGSPWSVDQWGTGDFCQFRDGVSGRWFQGKIVGTPANNQLEIQKQGSWWFEGPDRSKDEPTPLVSQVRVHRGGARVCLHAIVNSPIFQTLKQTHWGGMFGQHRESIYYADVYTAVRRVGTTMRELTCFSDHSTWSKRSGLYVPHPKGGGPWHLAAVREFFLGLLQAVKGQHEAQYGTPIGRAWCEWPDETALEYFSGGLHAIGSMAFWRIMGHGGSIDGGPQLKEENPGYRMVPLMAAVHPGRMRAIPVGNYFSNGFWSPGLGRGDPGSTIEQKLRKAAGFWFSEWVYGITTATLGAYGNGGADWTDWDPFDETNWDPSHPLGQAPEALRTLRELWKTLAGMELSAWCRSHWRYGELLARAHVEDGTTMIDLSTYGVWDVDSSVAYVTSHGFSGEVLYDHNAYPAVVHAAWRDPAAGTVALFAVNWSDTDAILDLTILPAEWEMLDESAPFVLMSVDPRTGAEQRVSEFSDQYRLTVEVPAWSAMAWIVEPSDSADRYRRQFWQLMPRGHAWTQIRGGVRDRFLEALGALRAAIEDRARKLLDVEVLGDRAEETVIEWEREFGLPDTCTNPPFPVSLEDRQGAVAARMLGHGDVTVQGLKDLAALFGVTITEIDEPSQASCEGDCEQAVYSEDWEFVFIVHAPIGEITYADCESPCDSPLADWSNSVLECVIRRASPAAVLPVFYYEEA